MFSRLSLVVVFVSFALGIAYYFLPTFGRDVLRILAGLSGEGAVLVVVATAVHYFSEMGRWWFYLRSRTWPDGLLLRRLLTIFSVTALVTYLLPVKLGVPLRLYLLTRELSIPVARTSGLLALDGVLSYAMWVTASIALYAFQPVPSVPVASFAYALPVIVLIGAVGIFLWRRVFLRVEISAELIGPSAAVGAVAVLGLDIAGYVVRHAAIVAALGGTVDWVPLAFATVASITAGFLSMLPMGLGAYDVTLVLLLTTFSVPAEIAVMVPVVNRAANILVAVLLGVPASYATGISLLTLRRRFNMQGSDARAGSSEIVD